MLALELAVLVLVGCAFSTTDAAKCDDGIIKKIEESWTKAGGPPKGLLLEISAAGKAANVKVSENIGPSNIKCMFTTLEQGKKKPGMDLHYTNVFQNGEEKTGTIYVEEKDGHLENKWADGPGQAYRYLVFSKPGVWAYYKCEKEGSKGNPQGLVKATLTAATAATDSIKEGVAALEKYGIKATKTLSTDCPVKGNKD